MTKKLCTICKIEKNIKRFTKESSVCAGCKMTYREKSYGIDKKSILKSK